MNPYTTRLTRDNPAAPNITVNAERGAVTVTLNNYKLFNTMANSETILVAINDKIGELLKRHLDGMASKETDAMTAQEDAR